jgi:hypothetical protein
MKKSRGNYSFFLALEDNAGGIKGYGNLKSWDYWKKL